MMMSDEAKVVLTKEDLKKINFRWLWGSQLGWNYGRMQAMGFLYAITPMLKKLYTNKEDLSEAMKMHQQFFNVTPDTGHIVVGAAAAMEATKGKEAREAVTGIKTGLMGPFSAIGDTVAGVIFGTIFGAIAATMAVTGNPIGVFIWIAACLVRVGIRWQLFYLGYHQGSKLVTTLASKLKFFTEAATLLGIMVIGALCASMVHVKTAIAFDIGAYAFDLQTGFFDLIMPKMLPICVVALVYWLLGCKGMNSTKVIFIVLVAGIMLSLVGVLGI